MFRFNFNLSQNVHDWFMHCSFCGHDVPFKTWWTHDCKKESHG